MYKEKSSLILTRNLTKKVHKSGKKTLILRVVG